MACKIHIKIKLCDGKDQYTLKKCDCFYDIGDYPAVTFPDISNYLVLQTSFYTAKQMGAFKSVEAYNFFISGWVKEVGTKVLNNNYRHKVGKVNAINSLKELYYLYIYQR